VYPIDREPTGKSAVARFTAVHLAAGAPPVDVATSDGKVLARNLAYGKASRPRRVPGGAYDIEVRVAGTSDVVLTAPKVELIGGRSSQVHVMGAVGGPALTAGSARYVTCCTRSGGGRRKRKNRNRNGKK
ncbi:MAG: DUF4397 domain-containing protein, partial [Chloroflexota bacterium]